MNLNKINEEIQDVFEELSHKVCDKLKGECFRCPFKDNCVCSKLATIHLEMEKVEADLIELIK